MERKSSPTVTDALVFSHSLTPRLQYVIDFFTGYYGLKFSITPDEERYSSSASPCKINYSFHRVQEGEIWIHPHALLFESAVHPVRVETFIHQGRTAFFRTEGDTGFDLFAALFYLVSRYEEYLPHQPDAYGRFSHKSALAFREGFLHEPLVNSWLEDFRALLGARHPAFLQTKPAFTFLPTYDIDMAWSFRYKGFKRNGGALLRLFFTGRWRSFGRRLAVIRGRRPDPFDAYDWLDGLHAETSLQPLYFFLVARQRSRYDRNITVTEPAFRQLVARLASRYGIGLHPSWYSGDHPDALHREKAWLDEAVQKQTTASRQHFLRFTLPDTYRRLQALGIREEYSMGYGTTNGFRASIATPFYWYDLKREETTELRVIPFCFMDANAYYEEGLAPEAALQSLLQYAEKVKAVGGTLCTVWHNSFLGSDAAFAGWREAYLQAVRALAAGANPAASPNDSPGIPRTA